MPVNSAGGLEFGAVSRQVVSDSGASSGQVTAPFWLKDERCRLCCQGGEAKSQSLNEAFLMEANAVTLFVEARTDSHY